MQIDTTYILQLTRNDNKELPIIEFHYIIISNTINHQEHLQRAFYANYHQPEGPACGHIDRLQEL